MRATGVVLMLTAALALAGCGPSRDDTGALTEAQDVGALDLRAGDCFNGGDGDEISEVAGVPCDEPHVYEVFAVAEHPDGDFPGEDALQEAGADLCIPPFADYVGVSYDDSQFLIQAINPSADTWEAGDRATLCVLFTEDRAERTGSAKGTAT